MRWFPLYRRNFRRTLLIGVVIATVTTLTAQESKLPERLTCDPVTRVCLIPPYSSEPVQVASNRTERILDCIARIESHSNPKAVSRSGKYSGAWQFSRSTWNSVSNARQDRLWPLHRKASMAEQRRGARRLYELRGLQPWPPARNRCR